MTTNAAARFPVRIPPEKKAELHRLTNPPKLAWPTVFVALYVVAGVVAVDVAALRGLIPLWVGMLLNIATMYPFFHVMHDTFHRSASASVRLNDWIGRIVLLAIGFLATLEAARYSHMMHHRFTNEASDPDHYFHGSWWTLPWRWMSLDVYYYIYNSRRNDPPARKTMRQSLPYTAVALLLVAALVYAGYGWEVLMLWFVPQRIVFGLTAISFLWLPHLARDERGGLAHIKTGGDGAASAGDSLTAGTTMRLGFEGLLAPLMQWHNYHLIHHLWPTTPAYNHAKVWELMEPELRARDLRIQRDFDAAPTLYLAGQKPASAH